jgi:hypothetical protein
VLEIIRIRDLLSPMLSKTDVKSRYVTGAKPRMPSHMAEVGKRGPLPHCNSVLGTEETCPECTASVAAPGLELPPPVGGPAVLPGMSASPPPVSLPENTQHSSTEHSEESDLGPFSMGNETELEGIENNESITAALKLSEHSEARIFSGLALIRGIPRTPDDFGGVLP